MEEIKKDLQSTMTDEDVKTLNDYIEKEYNNIASNIPDTKENGESRLVNVSIDPTTGKEIVNNTNTAEDDNIDFDKLLEKANVKLNVDESPITLDEVKKYIETAKENPDSKTGLEDSNFSIEDLEQLLPLLIKYQNKENIESLYKKMPESCQKIINKSIGIGDNTVYTKDINTLRNSMSEMFLDQFVSSITIDRASDTINTGIEKIFNVATSEIGDTIVGYTEDRNKEYREYIENNINDPVKKEEANKILDSIEKSYELSEFKEFCKTCKIRKFDVEKPNKNNRDMDYIMNKYKDEPKYNIYNIYNAQIVLSRNLNKEEDRYSDQMIRAFFLAFAKYCRNFKPSNTYEHIFMFYTLYNILLTDVNTGDKAEVSNIFLSNVKDCIRYLVERNNFLSN